MTILHLIIASLVALIAGIGIGYVIRQYIGKRLLDSADNMAKNIISDAKREAEKLRQEATVKSKADLLSQREEQESEFRKERTELKQIEKRLSKREDNLDRKVELLDAKEQQIRGMEEKIEKRVQELDDREGQLESLIDDQKAKLHEVANMSQEDAKAEVIRRTENEMAHEIEVLVQRSVNRAKERAEEEAQNIVANAIDRLAVDYTTEHVVSTVELPSDDMKGRIIGREGRNIRAFENATGIDVIVDDTPGVVVLSGFDPIRREIAVRSMAKLVADGRIHPARIEEVVIKTREDMEKVVEETGKEVAMEVDVRNLKPREIMLIGRLKYRTSYGQNQLDHSREVAFLSGMLAEQLGLDSQLARRCGLLHDIGKAVDHEQEGTHPELGGEVAKLCGEDEHVIKSIMDHHSTSEPSSIYTVIVQAADAISAGRPGARRETLEKYVKRLERLETIATSYEYISKAFAIQAGRELRVIANADKMNDDQSAKVCRQIAKQIEDELTYPGEVKVTLIRETRITEYAR
ncbi:MAG: ribonuclease Y [Planctomycetes bacterium]|nr:ribonuclease Y [Planctomycetota bacterium]